MVERPFIPAEPIADPKLGYHSSAPYDALAPFYDRYWGAAFLQSAIRLFHGQLAARLRPHASVLELCCGTGSFAQWLTGRGYHVTGVDFSRSMLQYAHQRLGAGRLLHADIRELRLYRKFEAAICFYNSLNQFLEPEQFRAALSTAFHHIQPGGWFLFDIVLESGYREFWHTEEVVSDADSICELSYHFDQHRQLASCHVTIGPLHRARAHRSRLLLQQRPYTLIFVGEELRKTGFQLVAVHPIADCNPPVGRVAVLARRPARSNKSK